MRSGPTFLLTFLILLLLSSCDGGSSDDNTLNPAESADQNLQSGSIEFEKITVLNLEVMDSGCFVFNSRAEWIEFTETNDISDDALTNVDFDSKTVLAVFAGRKSSAGYSIDIVSVTKASGEAQITVSYEETVPPEDGITASVLTYPCSFVTISKTDTPVIFQQSE